MIHFSLFSGIGGFDLAAEWMGWDNYLSCEIEDFPNHVLNHYWPDAYHHRDIKNLDYDTIQNELTRRFGEWRTKPVILTGGFPCQPYSQAGQRKGKEDERHLWPEMLRLIHEIKPEFIVGENVFGLLNWNGGMVFDEVLTDLGSAGYDVTPLVIPAAAVNAPHGRDRVWFVAYSNGNGLIQERRYDSISKNVDGCNTSCEWSTNSKDIDGCGTNGVSQEQSTISKRISQQANGEKNKTPNSRAVCGMDKANNCKGTIGKNRVIINKSGTLVSERQSRVFSSINRGLGNNKASSGELANMGLSIDISRINSMDWDATDTNGNGLNQCNGNDEINSSEGRIDALGDVKQSDVDGDATDTNGTNHKTQSQKRILGQANKGQKTRRFIDGDTRIQWNEFPTQSPICGGDDGLPTELDGITLSKWRKESIKGYGNAIVPQVVYEIFKAIELAYSEITK